MRYRVEREVENAIQRFRMAGKGDVVVAGVSGGPDSMAMLCLLAGLQKKLGFSLVCAHFDHKVRRGSARDGILVSRACGRLSVPFCAGAASVDLRRQGDSLEQACRQARQEFFSKIARKHHARIVALAHTLDDQAETVLMRMVRGSGLYGISAITPKRRIGGCDYVRPLLGVRKSEIMEYLSRNRVRFAVDETNKQEVFLRNKVRRRLLPLLERYNPQIKESLCNLAESAAFDYEFLAAAAHKELPKKARPASVSLKLSRLQKYHPSLRRMVIRLAMERVQGSLRRITFQHVRDIEDLVFNRPDNSAVHLPQGVRCLKKPGRVVFSA